MTHGFSGSYLPEDVTFLLKRIELPFTTIAEKERLIQSGARHYSEMISRESPPSPAYLNLFEKACLINGERFAIDLIHLARHLADTVSGELTIVSLARAGTPVGVLLKRLLERYLNRNCRHYSISIIRDRGIDTNALRYILDHEQRSESSIVFIDGWTGKGVIAAELKHCVERFNRDHGSRLAPDLHVVTDISGTAAYSPSCDDYLVPSAIMNAVVSGLISRSVLNYEVIGSKDFHGCLYYQELEDTDLSKRFVDEVTATSARLWLKVTGPPKVCAPREKAELLRRSQEFMGEMQARFGVSSVNHVKPGIGEATRVLLRRVPSLLLVQDVTIPDVAHLKQLALEKHVPIEEDSRLPYRAAAIIAEAERL